MKDCVYISINIFNKNKIFLVLFYVKCVNKSFFTTCTLLRKLNARQDVNNLYSTEWIWMLKELQRSPVENKRVKNWKISNRLGTKRGTPLVTKCITRYIIKIHANKHLSIYLTLCRICLWITHNAQKRFTILKGSFCIIFYGFYYVLILFFGWITSDSILYRFGVSKSFPCIIKA